MGAHDYTVTYDFYDKTKVKKAWESLYEEDSYESGSGAYAGNATTMGDCPQFYDKAFASRKEARRWVLDNHQKWGQPYACSFYLPKETSAAKQKRIDKAKQKLDDAKKNKLDWMNAEIDSFSSRKSAFIGCKCCGSKLSRDWMSKGWSKGRQSNYYWGFPSLPTCPVCKESLLSETAKTRLERLNQKVLDAEAALEKAEAPEPSKKLGWVVGGWAAC